MSNAMLNIYVRVILRRMADGEKLNDILDSYPKLTEEERQQITNRINEILGMVEGG